MWHADFYSLLVAILIRMYVLRIWNIVKYYAFVAVLESLGLGGMGTYI
jgi:hypothetical protein